MFTLTGTLQDHAGEPLGNARLVIAPDPEVTIDHDGNVVHVGGLEPVTDAAGSFSVELVWGPDLTYSVRSGSGGRFGRVRFACAEVADGGTVDLADVTPVEAPSPMAEYLRGRDGVDGQDGSDATVTDAAVASVLTTGTQTAGALADRYAARTILPATRMRSWGHSLMDGVGPGVTRGTNDMATLAAADLLLPLSNKAVGGTALYNHLSAAAHWGVVLTEEKRPTSFVPRGGFFPVMYGLNDLNYTTQDVAGLATFRAALRTVISRLRAGAVFEESHASVVLGGGTWTETASTQPRQSGAAFRWTTTVGATIAITTPTDFPGGTMVLGFLQWQDGSGGTVSGTVNGQTYSINTALTSRTDARTPAVLRIPNVPAGQATYTFTVTAVTGPIGLGFDYWQWEPPEHTAPLVVLVGQPKPLDYAGYGSGSSMGGPPTDAGVDALNTVQQELAAEFGSRVIYVDTSGIDKDPAYWTAGNVHPNAAGHAYLASRIATEVKARASFTAVDLSTAGAAASSGGGSAPAPATWADYVPTLAGSGTSIGNGTFQIAQWARDGDLVYFFLRFLAGSTTVIGTQIEVTLPTEMLSVASAISLEGLSQKAGVGNFQHVVRAMTTTTLRLYHPGTNGQISPSNATVPFTWAANDSFDVRGTYRAKP